MCLFACFNVRNIADSIISFYVIPKSCFDEEEFDIVWYFHGYISFFWENFLRLMFCLVNLVMLGLFRPSKQLYTAVVKIAPFILVNAKSTGSFSQLHFDSSIMLFRNLVSSTVSKDCPFRRFIPTLMKVFPADNCSLLTGDTISYIFRTSISFWKRSLRCIGTLFFVFFLHW